MLATTNVSYRIAPTRSRPAATNSTKTNHTYTAGTSPDLVPLLVMTSWSRAREAAT